MLKQQIEQDLKTALLAGAKLQVTVLRSLKSAITYAEVAQGQRDKGLDDQAILQVLAKEAKKRQESADAFLKGAREDRANEELVEKKIIEKYLPQQLSETEVEKLLDAAIQEVGELSKQTMGQVIGKVKQASRGSADGATIARLVQERMKS